MMKVQMVCLGLKPERQDGRPNNSTPLFPCFVLSKRKSAGLTRVKLHVLQCASFYPISFV